MIEIVSLDFDNTITHNPLFFKELSKNYECVLISSREATEENKEEIFKFLKDNDIKVKSVFLCGGFMGKLEKIKELKPEYHIDDYQDVINFIREFIHETIGVWIANW